MAKNTRSLRNIGIKKSSGIFLCFLDSDDTFRADKLSIIYSQLVNRPVLFGHHDALIFDESSTLVKSARSRYVFFSDSSHLRRFGNGIVTSSVFMSRKFILDNQLFFSSDSKFFAWEDYEYWIRILDHLPASDNYLFIRDSLSYVYEGSTSISKSSSANQLYWNISSYIDRDGTPSPWIFWACLRHGYAYPPNYNFTSIGLSLISHPLWWISYAIFLFRRYLNRL